MTKEIEELWNRYRKTDIPNDAPNIIPDGFKWSKESGWYKEVGSTQEGINVDAAMWKILQFVLWTAKKYKHSGTINQEYQNYFSLPITLQWGDDNTRIGIILWENMDITSLLYTVNYILDVLLLKNYCESG